MATFKTSKIGKWQAQIAPDGKRSAKTFDTKQGAKDRASRQEYLILNPVSAGSDIRLADVFTRYGRELSSLRRGERWEVIRLARLSRDRVGAIAMSDLAAPDFADWRDRRLREVKPASVAREMNLISANHPSYRPVIGLSLRWNWKRWRCLRFHDSGRAATTRLAKKLDVLDLAKMTASGARTAYPWLEHANTR